VRETLVRDLSSALAQLTGDDDEQTEQTICRIDRWHTMQKLEQLNLLVLAGSLSSTSSFTRKNSKQM